MWNTLAVNLSGEVFYMEHLSCEPCCPSHPHARPFPQRWESSRLAGSFKEIPAFAGMTGYAGITGYAGMTSYAGRMEEMGMTNNEGQTGCAGITDSTGKVGYA